MGNLTSRSTLLFRPLPQAQQPLVMLITGASSGMGKEMARTMLQRGHVVYGAARRLDHMRDLEAEGGRALQLDVSDPQQLEAAVETILKEQDKIDVLVNNAGQSVVGSAEDVSMERLRRVMEVNFFGLARLTQLVLPHMRSAQSGLIVNVGSVMGVSYKPFTSAYSASKHALEGYSDCLRTEVASHNIKVSVFEPGFVDTDIFGCRTNLTPPDSVYKDAVDAGEAEYASFLPKAAPPSVVADALVHACESGQPKRRYVMGHMGYPVVLARRWLGDGVIDFMAKTVLDRAKNKNNHSSKPKTQD